MKTNNILVKLRTEKTLSNKINNVSTTLDHLFHFFNWEDFFIQEGEKRLVANPFMHVEILHFKNSSSSFHLSTKRCKIALNVLHAILNTYLFFKQHLDSWHDLSSLGQRAFTHTRVKHITVHDSQSFQSLHKACQDVCWRKIVLMRSSRDI